MVAHRNSPDMKLERKEFAGDREDPTFKGIPSDRLEAWLRFCELDLFKFLVKIFRDRRTTWISYLISPETLQRECKRLGVGLDYWQGAYMEDGLFEDLFARMQREFDRRNATGERQSESADILGGTGLSPKNGPGPRFGYKNP